MSFAPTPGTPAWEGFAFWVDSGITIDSRIEHSFTEDVARRHDLDPATKTRKMYAELADCRLAMTAILGLCFRMHSWPHAVMSPCRV